MIYIEQNALNKIFVDVSSATGSTPTFLWNLKNSQGMNVKNFIPRDITSTYPSQYAGKYKVFEFSTIPSLPENLTPTGSSVVNIVLPNLNQFWLTIYEQVGIVNLNPNNAVPVLNSLAFSFWDKSQEYYTGNTSNVADNVIYYSDGGVSPSPTPSPSVSPTSTPTPTPTPTPSSTPSPINPEWNLGGGFDNNVWGIYPSGSDFYFVGRFNTYDGNVSPGIIKTDGNGNIDPNFLGRKPLSTTQTIYSMFDDGANGLILCGTFLDYDGFVNADRFVRVDRNTGEAIGFTSTTFNNVVYEIVPLSNGQRLVYGTFTTYTGGTYQYLMKFNNDWSVDNTYWNSSSNISNTPERVIENSSGNYVMVGNFTTYQGNPVSRIIEVDGITGLDTGLFGTGSSVSIRDLTKDSSGNYYISMGSNSGTFNGSSFTSPIIKVDSSGNLVSGWGVGAGSFVLGSGHITIDETNGWLYTSYIGSDYPRRLVLATGDIDTTWTNLQQTNLGVSSQATSRMFYVDPSNKVYFVGGYTILQSHGYNRFIRLNPDGTSNTTTT
jgi:hypothetical protein